MATTSSTVQRLLDLLGLPGSKVPFARSSAVRLGVPDEDPQDHKYPRLSNATSEKRMRRPVIDSGTIRTQWVFGPETQDSKPT